MNWFSLIKSKLLGTVPKLASGKSVHTEQSGEALAAERKPECKDVGELADKMERDYQVQLGLKTLTANLKAVNVTVSVESGDARAAALADQLQVLWDQTLTRMLPAVGRGRVAFEKVLEYDPETNLNTYRKLQDLPYQNTSLKLTPDGSYDGIELTVKGQDPVHLPAEKTWWLALDPDVLHPHGKSRYQGAPEETWKDRQKALKLREVFIKRFVIGWAKAHVEKTIELEDGQIVSGLEVIANNYSAMKSGGILAMPNTRDKDTGDYLWDIEQLPEVKSIQPLDDCIDGMDAEQLRALGIPEKTVTEGEGVGSYAMVSQQMLTLFAVVEDILDQFVVSFQKYVIDPICAYNWETPPKITIGFARLTSRPDSLLVETVKGLLLNPQMLEVALSGGLDLRQMLETAGIPITEGFETLAQDAAKRIQTVAQTLDIPLPAADPSLPVDPANASGGVDVPKEAQLNGAQITAAIEVLRGLALQAVAPAAALELLTAVGIERGKAAMMVKATQTSANPQAAADLSIVPGGGQSAFFLDGSTGGPGSTDAGCGHQVPPVAQSPRRGGWYG